MKNAIAVLAVIVTSSFSSAQLTAIGPFTGAASEGFEGPQVVFPPCIPTRVFSNQGDLCTPGYSACLTTVSWGGTSCTIFPNSGNWLFGSADHPAELTFDVPASRFGGWFGTNQCCPDATFDFYDSNNVLIASLVGVVPNDCTWHWLGWDVGAGTPIKSVRMTSNASNGGAFLDMDDLQADFGQSGAQPTPYCTAGTSSNGCVPAIGASANPSVSHATSCNITVSGLEGQRTAIIFYGINQTGFTAHAWATGSNSFLCVKSPSQRTGVGNSNGTVGVCNGSLVFGWNAYQSSHPSALGNPFAVGQKVYAQCWYRDPPAPKTTNLSNAIELTCVP
jgi:hypothetical protein